MKTLLKKINLLILCLSVCTDRDTAVLLLLLLLYNFPVLPSTRQRILRNLFAAYYTITFKFAIIGKKL